MKILFHRFAVLCLPLLLSQCVWSNSDPGFDALLNSASNNQSPDAIVGMWHRKDTRVAHKGSTMSFLFKRDGTVHLINHTLMLGGAVNETGQREVYRYFYAGSGIWRIQGTKVMLTISHGKLLFHMPILDGFDQLHYIFERM